jgi:peptidyl-prolyl cis-trans isomerase SurA
MKKISLVLLVILPLLSFGQKQANNPVVFCFGKNKVYQSEVERGYLRNKDIATDKPTEADVDDYLVLYQNFKLKVQDAKDRKMDTLPEYIKELAQYRRQLAKKYLNDSAVTEDLVKEGYNRSKEMVNASHILILAGYGDSPADTLKAYNKLLDIRKRLIAKSISFDQAAMTYSEDPSAKTPNVLGYKGNLGWFSAFQFLYEFEDVAYRSKKGEISPIFRTRYGYHILKVNDRKTSKGERKIATIKIYRRPNAKAEDTMNIYNRVQAVYSVLSNGEGWDTTLLKYTEDPNARYNRGIVNWFSETTDKVPSEVINEAFDLTVKNQISKPILTKNAYYIIRLLDKRDYPSFEDKEYEIRNKVTQDSRIYKSTVATVQRIKTANAYSENLENLNVFAKEAGNEFAGGTWKTANISDGTKELFKIGNEVYSLDTFSKFIESVQGGGQKIKSGESVIKNLYKNFVDRTVLDFEDRNLESKYPEFKDVYQDFRDGILFFNINSQEVWNKPMTDTAGMRNFYNANQDSFVWKDRVEMLTINAASDQLLDQAHVLLKQGIDKDSVMRVLNKDNALNIFIEKGLYEKGMNKNADNLIVKKAEWSPSNPYMIKKGLTNGVYRAYVGVKIIPSATKPYNDSRGQLSAMYQDEVEDLWLEGLRKKYKIKVHKKNYAAFKNKMINL